MSSQPLLAPRVPETGPWTEAWYVLVRPREGDWSLWARYTIDVPAGGAPRAHVWAVAHPGKGAAPVARRVRVAPPADVLDTTDFRFHAKEGILSAFDASGDLGDIAWDLRWEDPLPAYSLLPFNWMLKGPFPRQKVATPVPHARATGFVEAGDVRHDVDGAHAMVGHTWGRGHAAEWAWVHASGLGDDGNVFEAVTGSPLPGAPPVTTARLRVGGVVHHFTDVRTLVGAASEWSPASWTLRARHGAYLLVADVRADPARVAAVAYDEPGGGHRVCHASPLADVRVTLRRRGEAAVQLDGTGSFEVGALEADPRYPRVL